MAKRTAPDVAWPSKAVKIGWTTPKSATMRDVDALLTRAMLERVKTGPSATHGEEETLYGDGIHDLAPRQHHRRQNPVWINRESPVAYKIMVDTSTASSEQAQDFVEKVADPVSQSTQIHQFRLDAFTISAGLSSGLSIEGILEQFDRYLKTEVPDDLREFINKSASRHHAVKVVSRGGRHNIVTFNADVLRMLVQDVAFGPLARKIQSSEYVNFGDTNGASVLALEIPGSAVQPVLKRCRDLQYPVLQEYDYVYSDIPKTDMNLSASAKLRPYQHRAVSKIIVGQSARSGIIALPAGTGKTLVGITAACIIRNAVLVVCTSEMSVSHWRSEFLKWTYTAPEMIATITKVTDKITRDAFPDVIIMTYAMLTRENTSKKDEKDIHHITTRKLGLMVLDETNLVPAEYIRTIASLVKTPTKLGFTTTMLRGDNQTENLGLLIGPKLFQSNWIELWNKEEGLSIQCAEVVCPLPNPFSQLYMGKLPQIDAMCTTNPEKFRACQILLNLHEGQGNKTIILSDHAYSLKRYALKLGRACVHEDMSPAERARMLDDFQRDLGCNTLFISTVAVATRDLPEADALILLSRTFISQRHEAERLGRVLTARAFDHIGLLASGLNPRQKEKHTYLYSILSSVTRQKADSVMRNHLLRTLGHNMLEIRGLNFDTTEALADWEQEEIMENLLLDGIHDESHQWSKSRENFVAYRNAELASYGKTILKTGVDYSQRRVTTVSPRRVIETGRETITDSAYTGGAGRPMKLRPRKAIRVETIGAISKVWKRRSPTEAKKSKGFTKKWKYGGQRTISPVEYLQSTGSQVTVASPSVASSMEKTSAGDSSVGTERDHRSPSTSNEKTGCFKIFGKGWGKKTERKVQIMSPRKTRAQRKAMDEEAESKRLENKPRKTKAKAKEAAAKKDSFRVEKPLKRSDAQRKPSPRVQQKQK